MKKVASQCLDSLPNAGKNLKAGLLLGKIYFMETLCKKWIIPANSCMMLFTNVPKAILNIKLLPQGCSW